MATATATLRATGESLATVWRNRALRNVNLAFAASGIGDWAYATAMVVWAYTIGGVTAVGIWGTARLLGITIASPFGSTLVDRFPRKLVMVGTDLTRAVLVTIAAVLVIVGGPPLLVFAFATLAALAAAPFRPALAALLPSLVDRPEELTAANGAASTIESISFFAGPAVGGILLTVASVPSVILFNAATFVVSALLVVRIRVNSRPETSQVATERPSFATEVAAGFRTIWHARDLRLVTLVYCAQTIVAGASIAFVVGIAVQMTHFGPKGVGYLDSALGVGAVVGGLVAIARSTARRVAVDFGVGVIFWALPLLLIAVWPKEAPAFIALFVIGFANPIVDVNASTILQRLTDDEVMGRVFGALQTGLMGAMALGSVLMPGLIAAAGLRWALAILALSVSLIVLPVLPRLRRLDKELREPPGLALLRGLPLFAPLDPMSLERVAHQLVRREYGADVAVIVEGEPGDRFYIVESGSTTASFQGRELSIQQPGDAFGEIALLRDVPRTASVTTNEPTVLLSLERDQFLAAVTGNSEVSDRAEDMISRRIPTY